MPPKKVYLLQSILVLVGLFAPNHWALERLVFLGWDHDRTGIGDSALESEYVVRVADVSKLIRI